MTSGQVSEEQAPHTKRTAVPSLREVASRGSSAPVADTRPCKIEAERMNFYYGATRALEDISIRIQPNLVTAFIGPSGCGKSTFLRTLNRMNDIIPDTRVEGRVLLDGTDIYGPAIDVVAAAAPGRHGVSEVESVPEIDLRERGVRPAHQRDGEEQANSSRRTWRRAFARPPCGTR